MVSEVPKMDGKMELIRVLIAKPGLDGHDRGAKVVARALKDAGMEVIYTGLHQTVDQIANVALQESVDVIGLSILSGAHISLIEKLIERLKAKGIHDDILLVVGGNIPRKDIGPLRNMGVAQVFSTGSDLDDIVDFIKGHCQKGSPS
jgi:methylmalonyl-CoA mutase C-terminal domain/subunit